MSHPFSFNVPLGLLLCDKSIECTNVICLSWISQVGIFVVSLLFYAMKAKEGDTWYLHTGEDFFAEELYFVCESRQPVSLNVCNLLFISITPSHLYVHLKGNHQVIHTFPAQCLRHFCSPLFLVLLSICHRIIWSGSREKVSFGNSKLLVKIWSDALLELGSFFWLQVHRQSFKNIIIIDVLFSNLFWNLVFSREEKDTEHRWNDMTRWQSELEWYGPVPC